MFGVVGIWFMRFNINQKLLLLFASFSTVLVVAGSAAFYQSMRLVLVDNTRAELVATAIEKEAALASWFDERATDIGLLAASGDVRQAISGIISDEEDRRLAGRTMLLRELDERVATQEELYSLVLLDIRSAGVLAATDAEVGNMDWSREAAFFNGRAGTYLQTPYRPEGYSQPVMMIATPVRTEQGQDAGVLVAIFKVGVLDEILSRRGFVRQTDEAFLVNSASRFVTLPRLDGQFIRVLETPVNSPAVESCLMGRSDTDISPDYRNITTINAYRWVPQYGLCLVVKVDQSEALRPAGQLLPVIVLSAAVILIFGVLVAGLISRNITRPVLALTSGAERLAAGDRDVRLAVDSHDELGQLAAAFNSMSAALVGQERQLRDYAGHLEQMVERRTSELHASEALGRAVMENSPVGISVRDGKGNLVFWNKAWLSILGTDEAELEHFRTNPGSARARYILKGELDQDVQYVQLEGGLLFIPEMQIDLPRQSAPRWISEYSYAIPNPQGKIDRVVALTEDITESKQRQQEMEKLLMFSAVVRAAETRLELEEAVLEQVRLLIGVENVGIILRDPADFEVIRGRGCGLWTDWGELVNQPAHVGIAGDVLRTGQMYLTDNVYSDPRLYGNNLGDVSALCLAPLVTHEVVTGAIAIGAKTPFNESQVRLFRALGDLVANAFYRLSLSELTERRLQWLTAIRAIDQSIIGSIDLRITFNVLLDRTVNQLALDAAGILLLKQNNLEYAAWRGFREIKPGHIIQRLGEPQAGRAALDQRTVVVEDYQESTYWKSEVMESEGLRGYCAVPLITKGQVKGVLEVFSRSPLRMDAEWLEFLESLAGLAAISIENATLIEAIQRTNTELSVAYDSTLMGWAQTVELRDRHKQGHSRRMADMTLDLARMLNVDEKDLVHIYRGVLLHDIGTMAIPDEILLKDGPLTPEERALLETHTLHSQRMIQSVEYLRPAMDIPYAHHEKWDGSGYPRGLKGDQIPLAARIFAVVEVWDALTHDRPHRKALTEAEALEHIRAHGGRHFDPLVVEAFLRLLGK